MPSSHHPKNFAPTHFLSTHHLIPQPADLALDPPEGYLYVQDFLIISCGVLYALCYAFYMARTWRDGRLAGFVEFLSGTISYEIFYALTTTTTAFEKFAFLIWFLLDVSFASIALCSAYPRGTRLSVSLRTLVGVVLGLAFYTWCARTWPDEREQVTAYWTGLALQFPIGWGSLWILLRRWDGRGHSFEIWLTRFLGCLTAYAVFIWRYLNVPSNWSYVNSSWSWWVIGLTMLPECVYPFVLVAVHRDQKRREGGKRREKGRGGKRGLGGKAGGGKVDGVNGGVNGMNGYANGKAGGRGKPVNGKPNGANGHFKKA